MARFRLVSLAVMAGSFIGLSSGFALADDQDSNALPCNSLCERWMRIGHDDANPVPPTPPSDIVAPVGGDHAATAVAIAPNPPRDRLARPVEMPGKALGQKAELRPHLATVEVKPAQRPVPLPPRRMRTLDVVASLPAPVPMQPAPATPFGTLQPTDQVTQVVAALPMPPTVPYVPPVELLTTQLAPVPHEEPADKPQAAKVDGSAAAVVGQTSVVQASETSAAVVAPSIEPVRVVVAAKETVAAAPDLPPPSAAHDADWPPPIDIIGALLAGGGRIGQSP